MMGRSVALGALIAVVLLVQLLLVPKEKAQRKLMGGNA